MQFLNLIFPVCNFALSRNIKKKGFESRVIIFCMGGLLMYSEPNGLCFDFWHNHFYFLQFFYF